MSVPEWFKKAIKNKPLSRFIKVKGVDIHYLVWGDISKPGLFLIHGYSAHAHWWDFIAPNFIDNYCVVAIDLSGMGDSEHRDSYSQSLYSLEIKSVCEEMGWNSANFLAHSMGGPISIKAASLYPDLFERLFLLDAVVVVPPDKARSFSSRNSMVRNNFIYEDFNAALDSFRLIPPQPCKNEFLLKHIAEHSFKNTDEGWLLKSDASIMRSYEYEDLTEIFMDLKCPTYLVYGLMSQILSQEILEYTTYVGNLPAERVVGIAGAMHHIFIDEPLVFVKEIKKLLK
ncbi:MAG: alpha/beta hydrolase [Pseudomonadota bacterium]|nr:alpha/beta hydrolase [Pseudomonadota bacterium]